MTLFLVLVLACWYAKQLLTFKTNCHAFSFNPDAVMAFSSNHTGHTF